MILSTLYMFCVDNSILMIFRVFIKPYQSNCTITIKLHLNNYKWRNAASICLHFSLYNTREMILQHGKSCEEKRMSIRKHLSQKNKATEQRTWNETDEQGNRTRGLETKLFQNRGQKNVIFFRNRVVSKWNALPSMQGGVERDFILCSII